MTETAKGKVDVVEPTRAQKQLARRVAESRATVPDLTFVIDVDVEAALALGAPLRALVVRAVALALREIPDVNAAYRDGRFERYGRVNVAVSIDAAAPVISDADTKPLAAIADEIAQVTSAADQLAAPRSAGATCTVTAVDGVRAIVPPLTPPQAVALGVGAAEPRAVARDGEVVVAAVAELTLVCDHRIVYGARAAAFLARIRALLEEPSAL